MPKRNQPNNALSGDANYRPLSGTPSGHVDSPGSENVEDRENVGQVAPESYPEADRRASDATSNSKPRRGEGDKGDL